MEGAGRTDEAELVAVAVAVAVFERVGRVPALAKAMIAMARMP